MSVGAEGEPEQQGQEQHVDDHHAPLRVDEVAAVLRQTAGQRGQDVGHGHEALGPAAAPQGEAGHGEHKHGPDLLLQGVDQDHRGPRIAEGPKSGRWPSPPIAVCADQAAAALSVALAAT